MTMKVKITVISVIYNVADSIEDTIYSVIEQRKKRPDIELDFIIIDGASTDGTLKFLEKHDTEISNWISEKDNGIYDAMNKGLKMVEDGYVLFLGSGDKIISLIDSQLLLGDKMNAFYGDVWIGDRLFTSHMNHKLKRGNFLHHQGLLIHRSVFPVNGFNLIYKAYADYDLNIRLLNSDISFIKTSSLIGFQRPGGLTNKVHVLEYLDIIKSNFGLTSFFIVFLIYVFSEVGTFFTRKESNLSWVKLI